jgi:hypothetical protein
MINAFYDCVDGKEKPYSQAQLKEIIAKLKGDIPPQRKEEKAYMSKDYLFKDSLFEVLAYMFHTRIRFYRLTSKALLTMENYGKTNILSKPLSFLVVEGQNGVECRFYILYDVADIKELDDTFFSKPVEDNAIAYYRGVNSHGKEIKTSRTKLEWYYVKLYYLWVTKNKAEKGRDAAEILNEFNEFDGKLKKEFGDSENPLIKELANYLLGSIKNPIPPPPPPKETAKCAICGKETPANEVVGCGGPNECKYCKPCILK